MAKVTCTLVSATPSMRNGVHSSWTPPQSNDVLWNWDISVSIEGQNGNYIGQTLAKTKDAYPHAVGTVLTLETDWVLSYEKYKFKKVKDKAKEEARASGGGYSGGSSKSNFNAPQYIAKESMLLATEYLHEVGKHQELPALNFNMIKELGQALEELFIEDNNKDLFLKKDAFKVAIGFIKLNANYDKPVTSSKQLIILARGIYKHLLSSVAKTAAEPTQQPAQQAAAAQPAAAPAQSPAAAMPPPPAPVAANTNMAEAEEEPPY